MLGYRCAVWLLDPFIMSQHSITSILPMKTKMKLFLAKVNSVSYPRHFRGVICQGQESFEKSKEEKLI